MSVRLMLYSAIPRRDPDSTAESILMTTAEWVEALEVSVCYVMIQVKLFINIAKLIQ